MPKSKSRNPWRLLESHRRTTKVADAFVGAIRLQGAAGGLPCAPQLPFTAKYSNIWEILRDPCCQSPKTAAVV